jgi:PAS domain S-box-containing protein
MNRFFYRLPLLAKLLMIAAIPLFFAGYLTAQLYREKSENIAQIKNYLTRIDEAATVSRLTDQLQIERRFSFEYALRNIQKQEMLAQRSVTDSLIQELRSKNDTALSGFEDFVFIDNLDSVRSRIDRQRYASNAVMHFYSTAVFRLSNINRMPSYSNQFLSDVSDVLAVQKLLSEIITYQSIICANVYNILYTRHYVPETLLGTLPTYDVYKLVEKEMLLKSDPDLRNQYMHLKERSALKAVQDYLRQLFTTFKLDSSYTVDSWKNVVLQSLSQMRTFQNSLLRDAEKSTRQYYQKERSAQLRSIIVLVIVSLLILLFVVYMVVIISRSLQKIRRSALMLAQGKTGVQLSVHSHDAIGSLATSIQKIDKKYKELTVAAEEIGKGHFNVEVRPRSEEDVLGNAIMQMKENLLRYTNDLTRSREEFIKLADFMPQIVWTADANGSYDYYNKKWFEITGAKQGFGDQSWIPFIHPADVGYCLTTWYQSVETGLPYEIEYRLKDAKTSTYRWFLGRALPVKNEEGNVVKWFGTATDIHDQKMQNERLEELVQQRTLELNRSNEDLQQFAHVASHDLKEPLRKIRTFSDRLVKEFGSMIPEKGQTYINKLTNSSERMSNMIDSILNYSIVNATEQVEETIDLNLILEGIKNDLELLILQKEASIGYQKLPRIKGVPTLIYQLFYNLINNALKFSKEDSATKISISAKKIQASELKPDLDIEKSEHYWHIVVSDNGIGFNQEYADKMFNVFTRLNAREKFEGTGLGLALCRKIVHRHHGAIYACGEDGHGAEFHIILPFKA